MYVQLHIVLYLHTIYRTSYVYFLFFLSFLFCYFSCPLCESPLHDASYRFSLYLVRQLNRFPLLHISTISSTLYWPRIQLCQSHPLTVSYKTVCFPNFPPTVCTYIKGIENMLQFWFKHFYNDLCSHCVQIFARQNCNRLKRARLNSRWFILHC